MQFYRLDGGNYWQSGKPGALQAQSQQPPLTSAATKPQTKEPKKVVKVKILTERNGSSEKKPNLPQCGQCEKASASLVKIMERRTNIQCLKRLFGFQNCVECIENYCQVCFTKMHQKGGLAKHHVKPILRNVKKKLVSPQRYLMGALFFL